MMGRREPQELQGSLVVEVPADDMAARHRSALRVDPERPPPAPVACRPSTPGSARVQMNAPELEHACPGVGAHGPLRLRGIVTPDGSHDAPMLRQHLTEARRLADSERHKPLVRDPELVEEEL